VRDAIRLIGRSPGPLETRLDLIRLEAVGEALSRAAGNKTVAASILHKSRDALDRLLRRLEIPAVDLGSEGRHERLRRNGSGSTVL